MAQHYELNLRDYLRVLRKRFRVILVLVLVAGAATFLLTPRPDPSYSAEGLIKLTHQTTVASMFMDAVMWSYGDDLQTHSQVLRSRPLALMVGQSMGLLDDHWTEAELATSDELAARVAGIQAMYDAEPVDGTSLIRIVSRTASSATAVALVNTVIDTFIEDHTFNRNRQIIETRRFIERQLAEYEVRLKNAEADYTRFKTEHLSSLSLSENELARLNAQLEEFDRRIRSLSTLVDNLQSRIESPDATYVDLITGGWEDPAVEELNDELVRLQLRRERLLVDQHDESPVIANLEERIRALAGRLLEEYRETLAYLVEGRDELAAKFAALPANDAEAARLAREVKVNEDTYTLLKQRYQEALIKEAEKIQELSVVEYAAEAWAQRPPGRLMRTLAGMVVGLMLGLLLAFILETLDTSIDTIEDVEEYLQVPVVGIVPHFDLAQAQERLVQEKPDLDGDRNLRYFASVVTRSDRHSPAAEAFRTLRTNLQFTALRHGAGEADDGRAQMFVVTSSSEHEGKSTTAVNLAVVTAQMGKRVALVDCDLRNPRMSRFFGVKRSPGVTEVVLGSASLEDAIRSSADISLGRGDLLGGLASEGLDRLHILTAGTLPPHAAEVLVSPSFDRILQELRSRYDIILLDAPPVLPVTDPAILGTKSDGVILVHRLGKVSRNALRRAKFLLDNVKAEIWGIVLNDIRASVTGYRIDSYYGEGKPPGPGQSDSTLVAPSAARKTMDWLASLRQTFRSDIPASNGNGDSGDSRHPGPPEA